MKIFLIRHGESTGDAEKRYGGDYDDHLTQKGRKQARLLARKLKDKYIEIIFSSPRHRAKETAKILSKCLGCRIKIVPDLRERNFYGVLTGMKKSEARRKYPDQVALVSGSYKNTIKGGETYGHFKKRILKSFGKIAKSKLRIVALITHGGPISCIFRENGYGESRTGDCAYFELETNGKKFFVLKMHNAKLENRK